MYSVMRLLVTAMLLLLPATLVAQSPPQKGTGSKPSVPKEGTAGFAAHLFAPELIMQNQAEVKLTESQRALILQEIRKLEETATPLQWKIAEQVSALNNLLAQEPVAESQVIAQADRMMGFETAVKRAQLEMLVRIRNLLSAEQKETLRAIRRRK